MRRRASLAATLLAIVTALWAPALAQTPTARPLSPSELQRANQHYRTGWDLLRTEAFDDAAKEFQKAIEIDKDYAHAYYGLGKSYMALKKFDLAAQAYERCRLLYEAHTSNRVGVQLDANQQRREQIMQLKETLREYQRSPQQNQRTQLAVREIEDQIRQLQAAYDRGALVDPSMRVPAFVSLALGSAYFRSGRLSDAEKMYREAIKVKPDYGEAHNNLAVVYLQTGRVGDAENEVKLAEKAGYKVHPQLKRDIKERLSGS